MPELTVVAGQRYRNNAGAEMVIVGSLTHWRTGLYLESGMAVEAHGSMWVTRGEQGLPMLWTTTEMVRAGYALVDPSLPGFEEAPGLTHHLVPVYTGGAGSAQGHVECAYCGMRGGTGGVSPHQSCPQAPT